jgi:ubiquinone/menaquinone biosynthesis C-methylase UbiE
MSRRRHHDSDASAASRKYHNRVAKQYDQIYDDAYWEFHDELTWRAIKPHLPKSTTTPCLDLGCGTGKWGLKILKSGFPTTFIDHSPNMIDQTRAKVQAMGPRSKHATLLVADIVDLSALPADHFGLILAMGDPLSICSDAVAATREMFRISQPGAIVIATADNKLAALDHFIERGDIDALEDFIRTGRTNWLTDDSREQFELTMFTPQSLRRLFEKAGFTVQSVTGKTILPLRKHKHLLNTPESLERLLQLERDLAKDDSSASRASHLQIIAQKPSSSV